MDLSETSVLKIYTLTIYFFYQKDALNVKLLQREIEIYLDGSKHKR